MKRKLVYYEKDYVVYFDSSNEEHAKLQFYELRKKDVIEGNVKIFQVEKCYNSYKIIYGKLKEIIVPDGEKMPEDILTGLIKGHISVVSYKEIPTFYVKEGGLENVESDKTQNEGS